MVAEFKTSTIPETGDCVRGKSSRGEIVIGFANSVGRQRCRLTNDSFISDFELVHRLPEELEQFCDLVGKSRADKLDKLFEQFRFYNLSRWQTADAETQKFWQIDGWQISFYKGEEVDLSKDGQTWYLELKRHPELRSNGKIYDYCKAAIDHAEAAIAQIEAYERTALAIANTHSLTAGDRVCTLLSSLKAYEVERSPDLDPGADSAESRNCNSGNSEADPRDSRLPDCPVPEPAQGEATDPLPAPATQAENLPLVCAGGYVLGDKVQFWLHCFGEQRLATGVVTHISTIGEDGNPVGVAIASALGIEFECPLPPVEELAPVYFEAYPEDGIHRGLVQIPVDKVARPGETLPDPIEDGNFDNPFQVGDRVRIRELAGRNRKWLGTEGEVVEVSRHTRIRVWDEEFQQHHVLYWHPDWLELVERSPAEKAEILHDTLAQLEQERDRLLQEGLAPEGAWIEAGRVTARKFRQCYWRAHQPIFTPARSRGDGGLVKRKYIGEEGGTDHQKARAAWERRKRFESVIHQIEILQGQAEQIDQAPARLVEQEGRSPEPSRFSPQKPSARRFSTTRPR